MKIRLSGYDAKCEDTNSLRFCKVSWDDLGLVLGLLTGCESPKSLEGVVSDFELDRHCVTRMILLC